METDPNACDCNTCGHPCNDNTARKPCPSCGGLTRRIYATASARLGALRAEISKSTVIHGPSRPWQEQWRRVERYHAQIIAIYDGTAPGRGDAWRDSVFNFFVTVHHLFEWIENDPAEVAVSPGASGAHLRSDPNLSIALAVSNTHKHHTRTHGVRAGIRSITAGRRSNSISIYWTDGAASGEVDARDLADRCMQAWRDFFALHGLNPAG